MKKIIVLDKITNKEELFINNIKLKLKDCLVHRLSNTDKIDDIMDLLGWKHKLRHDKVSKLSKELYTIWEEYDTGNFKKITDYINNQFGDNHVFFVYATNEDRLGRLEKLYPKQVILFDLQVEENESNLNNEIDRLLKDLNILS